MRSTPGGRLLYYWDACIFLAWLHEDGRLAPGVLEGIEAMAEEINNGKATLMTSVITKTEVLEDRLKPHARAMFANLFKRRNVSYVVQDERVGDLSHAIRNYYAQPPRGIVLGANDSVHLATAILYKADCFYTLDAAGPRKRTTDLISLNGDVMGRSLRIEVPMAAQARLIGLELPRPIGRPKR